MGEEALEAICQAVLIVIEDEDAKVELKLEMPEHDVVITIKGEPHE